MVQSAEIQYPVAFNHLNDLVKIEDVPKQRGLPYVCVHCGDRMSAVVRVTQRKPHFRRTKSLICDPDSVLHSTAIEIIRNAHNTALSTSSPYLLTRPCKVAWIEDYDQKSCPNNATEIDLADGWQSNTEKSIIEGTRSDLIFSHDDGQQIIIEVVNTHSMEPETESAYRNSGIPFAAFDVEWATVNRLWTGIHIEDSHNFTTDECCGCRSKRLRTEADFERRRKIVDRVLAKMRRRSNPDPKFRPFYKARPTGGSNKPIPLFMKTQRKVFANAIILTELGFTQSNPGKKPWLFTKPIRRTPNVTLFADLGGSEVIPIYEDTAALLYTSLDFEGPNKDPVMNAYIVKEFGERLQNEGVQVRISFYKEYPLWSGFPFDGIDFTPTNVDPERRVDGRILGSMLKHVYP